MISEENVIQLALAFDDKYITPFYVLLASLFVNNKQNHIIIHVIVSGITDKDKEEINNYVNQSNNQIIFHEVDLNYVSRLIVPEKEENPLTSAMYYRLFFPFLVSTEVKRLLYIDVDTLVVGSLDEIATIDLEGKPVGAVADRDMPVRSDLGIYSADEYFNSGVLLIDIAKWKDQRISERALEIINDEPELIIGYPDQDALNLVLQNNWYRLDSKFNLMRLYVPNEVPKRRFKDFLRNQKIIHYNGKKPWFSNCEHRLRHVYRQYALLSPCPEATKITKVILSKKKRDRLFRSRVVEFYFDHPEFVAVWRKLKSLVA